MQESKDVVSAVGSRYSDAYIVARTIDGFGTALKYVGLGLGSLMAFAAVASTTTLPWVMPGSLGIVRFVAAAIVAGIGVGIAGCVGSAFYVLGTLSAAQGQILTAALDTAVNTSRLLSADDCAQILSLRFAGATRRTEVSATAHAQPRIPIVATPEQVAYERQP